MWNIESNRFADKHVHIVWCRTFSFSSRFPTPEPEKAPKRRKKLRTSLPLALIGWYNVTVNCGNTALLNSILFAGTILPIEEGRSEGRRSD